jgi:hydroxymethylpyrimidine/phosphomethylpyrimidine kinase
VKIALSIAGSDSGGGAGIQADLKTFLQFGVHGTTAITALTAQNTLGVAAVHPVPPAFLRAQLDALTGDLPPDAVKTGILADESLIRVVVDVARIQAWAHLVVDPVMVASSGDRLLEPGAESAMRDHLIPLATLITPNLDEAEILLGQEIRDPSAMERAGRALLELGAMAALVKGGHLAGDIVTDVLVTPDETRRFTRPRINVPGAHGTGCTLSAAITAGLAEGRPLERAVGDALQFVARAMESAPTLGRGHPPLNHGVSAR